MKLRNKKTGEVVDFKIIADYDNYASGWRLEKQDGSVLFYDHIDEIKDEWEDYAPAEPLIKDEKIRKAVRAWAEANDLLDEIEVHSLTAGTRFSIGNYDIDFLGYFIYDLEDNKTYTIAELCGEDEG